MSFLLVLVRVVVMRQDGTTVVTQVPVSSLHTVDVEGIKTTLKLFKTVWTRVVRNLKMLINNHCIYDVRF